MNEHDLKCWPEYYAEVDAGRKTFEIRKDDRGFRVGDVLLLREYEPQSKTYTGRSCRRVVTYVTNFGQPSGYVVMALRACGPAEQVKVHCKDFIRTMGGEWILAIMYGPFQSKEAAQAVIPSASAADVRNAFYEGAKAGAQAFSGMLCGLSNKPPHDVGTDRNALDHIVSRMHDKYGSPAGQVELAARAALAQEVKKDE